jgi:hypothetical protein
MLMVRDTMTPSQTTKIKESFVIGSHISSAEINERGEPTASYKWTSLLQKESVEVQDFGKSHAIWK